MCEINTSLGQFFELLKNPKASSDSLNLQNQRTAVNSDHFKNLKELAVFIKQSEVLWLVL
jgi:hypothetical protein